MKSTTAVAGALALWLTPPGIAQLPGVSAAVTPPTIASRTVGMERSEGLLPLDLDARAGRLFLELPGDSTRVLFFVSQATGLGSTPVGIDRGASGGAYVVRFDRDGDRVLFVLENWRYRSSAAGNPAHVRSVRESFPTSTSAVLPLAAADHGRLLVDVTELVFRDWLDVAGALARAGQGAYTVARDRSSLYRPSLHAFPDNTEIDGTLTFSATGTPGAVVERIVPDGRAFTVRQHLSFVRLPDAEYRPRPLDPRVGFFGITFNDYAQPVDAPLEQRWIARHRLARVNAGDPTSPIARPIVYYVDRGIPEPIRSATLEGAKFWERVFDEAGLRGGFVVQDLPVGVDPLDARYNVVQWVNRNERGWSVGGSLGDPRTGEIIKGMARMDSHRARTSYNLYAGLMGAEHAAAETAFVLARVRQVTAHEIGHTLGMAHNFISSTYDRGSVMDYPAPRIGLDAAGRIDPRAAYAPRAGAYDVWAIHWAYGIFPSATERDSLRALTAEGLRKGYLFLSDADARPESASDPRVNLWDDAANAADFFVRQQAVRRAALSQFGERNIRVGEPLALLQERLAPVYFFHRFAINALAKTIGGMEYSNAIRGDGLQATRPVAAMEQRRAVAALATALAPEELAIPDTVLTLLAPRPFGYEASAELFRSRTTPAFDALGAARTLAAMILDAVLQRERAARVAQFAARGGDVFTLAELVDSVAGATWRRPPPASGKLAALQRVTQRAFADRLLSLAADTEASADVRAMADLKLSDLRVSAAARAAQTASPAEARAHWRAIRSDLARWLDCRELPHPTPVLAAPPGDPFGDAEEDR